MTSDDAEPTEEENLERLAELSQFGAAALSFIIKHDLLGEFQKFRETFEA